MTYYIQRRGNGYLETVDEFRYRYLAEKALPEYQMADPTARYYVSSRHCANWRDRPVSKVVRPTIEKPPIPVPFGHPA
jgi:hypothetical protein